MMVLQRPVHVDDDVVNRTGDTGMGQNTLCSSLSNHAHRYSQNNYSLFLNDDIDFTKHFEFLASKYTHCQQLFHNLG